MNKFPWSSLPKFFPKLWVQPKDVSLGTENVVWRISIDVVFIIKQLKKEYMNVLQYNLSQRSLFTDILALKTLQPFLSVWKLSKARLGIFALHLLPRREASFSRSRRPPAPLPHSDPRGSRLPSRLSRAWQQLRLFYFISQPIVTKSKYGHGVLNTRHAHSIDVPAAIYIILRVSEENSGFSSFSAITSVTCAFL